MLAQDLIQLARDRYLDDVSTTGLLWSDEELLADLNWAYKRAAEWGLLIRDTDTAALCTITLVDSQPLYTLDQRIVTVESITLVDAAGAEYDVPAMARKDLLWTFGSGWRAAKGKPQAYEPTKSYQIRLVYMPDSVWAGKTLRLDVNRSPLTDLTDFDEPEIPASMHESLVYGLCAQAFLKRDADTEALAEANHFMDLFMMAFGPPTTHVDRMHRLKEGGQEQDTKRRGTVSPWKTPTPQAPSAPPEKAP